MRDAISNMQLIRGAVQTLSGTTANNSALLDRRGFDSVSIFAETGTVTDAGTAAGFTMKLQHSDTTAAADFTDVDSADLIPNSTGATTVTVTADSDDDILANGVGYVGIKRYVRAVFTGTTGTNAEVQILAVLSNSHRAPTTTIGSTTAAT
ncbi:MAG: hypothetical protein E6Q97_09595 [Desulfurellales bacterium]|nr:MAG: hypothetical protein E6Q97_09595 [Desulfurellales bacterium]